MIKAILTNILFVILTSNIALCDKIFTPEELKLIKKNELKRYQASKIYKLTEELSKFTPEYNLTLESLAEKAKELKIYSSASMNFGWWMPNQIYDSPLPFDLDKDHRYCIITFKGQEGEIFQVSILLKLRWIERGSKDRDTRAADMLSITTDFYTRESSGIEITRCWFNPWGNNGTLLVKDERKKDQDPITYWTTAVGRKPDHLHIEQEKKMENKIR